MVFQIDEETRIGDAWILPLSGSGAAAPRRITGIYDNLARDFDVPRQEKVTWTGAEHNPASTGTVHNRRRGVSFLVCDATIRFLQPIDRPARPAASPCAPAGSVPRDALGVDRAAA